MVFFALNFAAISSIVYLLLRYAIVEKGKLQATLQETHRLLQEEQDRSRTPAAQHPARAHRRTAEA